MRLAVDHLRMVLERRVHLDDLPAHRREELRDRLDRFDRAERLARSDRAAGFRELDEHDVAELILREVGDADLSDVARDADPLVVFCVLQVSGIRHEGTYWPGPGIRGP